MPEEKRRSRDAAAWTPGSSWSVSETRYRHSGERLFGSQLDDSLDRRDSHLRRSSHYRGGANHWRGLLGHAANGDWPWPPSTSSKRSLLAKQAQVSFGRSRGAWRSRPRLQLTPVAGPGVPFGTVRRTGKSSLIKRYVDGIFKNNYLFTIGGTARRAVTVAWTRGSADLGPCPPIDAARAFQSTLRSRTSS